MNNNVNKITILCVSGKKKDRDILWYNVIDNVGITDRVEYSKSTKAKKVIARIVNEENCYLFPSEKFMIFEGLSNKTIQNIGDELGNMILEIRLDKYNEKIVSQQIQETLELLEKL